MSFETPVAFLVYNRPDVTSRVFQEIARLKPRTLLVVADGPRSERPGDDQRVAATQAVIDHVDWPCDVLRNFSDVNLGCKQRIASGLDWIFNTVDEAIILEDDCLPSPSFFPFCQELLSRYRDDDRVMAISGDNFQSGQSRTAYSYYFSKYFHCWGWASWKRVWEKFDVSMNTWPEFRDNGGVHWLSDTPQEISYWLRTFENCFRDEINSWAFPWLYTCWSHSGLTILPDVNLVSNLGFGADATHTQPAADRLANLPTGRINQLQHPPIVVRNKEADIFTFSYVFRHKTPAIRRLASSLRKRVQNAFRNSSQTANDNDAEGVHRPSRRCA